MATVTPVSPFDARADADALHKAMKGMGTDEKGLINVLCKRPSHQRVNIAQIYKASFGKVNANDRPFQRRPSSAGATDRVTNGNDWIGRRI